MPRLVLAVVVPVAGVSAGSSAPSLVRYRVTFTGSGSATSAHPPAATGPTVYTSTIDWKLIYDVTIHSTPGQDFGWTPAPGSSVEGSSTGAPGPGGIPIEEGCEHIGFSLDTGPWGAVYSRRSVRNVVIRLYVPGFNGLVVRSPANCSDPFPSGGGGAGCPERELGHHAEREPGHDAQEAVLDAVQAVRRPGSEPDRALDGHGDGDPTSTAAPLRGPHRTAPADQLRAERRHGERPGGGRQGNVRARQDLAEPDGAPPPARLDVHGRFHVAYSAYAGAYHVQISGRVTGTNASGVLSTTSRFNSFSGTLDSSGTIRCRATDVHWTAVGSVSSAG